MKLKVTLHFETMQSFIDSKKAIEQIRKTYHYAVVNVVIGR